MNSHPNYANKKEPSVVKANDLQTLLKDFNGDSLWFLDSLVRYQEGYAPDMSFPVLNSALSSSFLFVMYSQLLQWL